jgi:hypothetical protein
MGAGEQDPRSGSLSSGLSSVCLVSMKYLGGRRGQGRGLHGVQCIAKAQAWAQHTKPHGFPLRTQSCTEISPRLLRECLFEVTVVVTFEYRISVLFEYIKVDMLKFPALRDWRDGGSSL